MDRYQASKALINGQTLNRVNIEDPRGTIEELGKNLRRVEEQSRDIKRVIKQLKQF